MKRSAWFVVMLAALCVASAAAVRPALAGAADESAPAPATAPASAVTAMDAGALALPALDTAMGAADTDEGAASFVPTEGIRSLSIRRRPRRPWREPSYSPAYARGFSQIHGGFFDPSHDGATGVLFGFRGGTEIDERIQLGAGVDWSHRSDRRTSVVSEAPLPGGGGTVQQLELARSSSDLVPIMAFLQFSPPTGSMVSPYFGIGGGYEVLYVSAQDFSTGLDYDATFGGWGWQAWGGVSLPLSGRTRFNAEVYSNQSEVSRDVDGGFNGLTLREIVNVDGMGMRFGLSWGF